MKYIIIKACLCLFFLVGCGTKSEFLKISDKIHERAKSRARHSWLTKVGGKARVAAFKNTTFLKSLSSTDTVYVMEMFDRESILVIGSIWKRKDVFSYSYRRIAKVEELKQLQENPFTKHQVMLIGNWDINGIRSEENSKENLTSLAYVVASRCYFVDDKIVVDQMIFKDFFNPVRDNLR